ncbi:MAG: putative membrane protein YfcA [Paracoccaceae bacterium]|jgi:uncharacterized membrane protein YfcA
MLAQALAVPGLGWMGLTILVAGLVRGFTGFGTALIFVPVATQFLPAASVILIMSTTGLFSMVALVPGAWKSADRGEVGTMALAALVTVPLGLWILAQLDGLVIRWIVTAVASATLLAVITGWRWHRQLGVPGRLAIGGAAGTVGGMTGLTGPVVIIFYLANARGALTMRSNTILFLAALDLVLVANLLLRGQVSAPTLWIAVVLALPYLVTTLIGQALFDPRHEKAYRVVAYGVVALAVISGLPILD